MTEYFLNNLSDDFKTKLLNDTRDEVYGLFKDSSLSDIDKSNIDMLFVQPLYYSKLESFFNVWLLENETSIEEILKSSYLSQKDKELFFSTLCNKLNIQSNSIETDTAIILNKLFLDNGNITASFDEIISETGDEIWSAKAATNYPKFNSLLTKFTTYSFYAPVAIDNLKSDYNTPYVFDAPIIKSDLDEYSSLTNKKTYLNNAVISLNPKNVKSSSVNIDLSNGDSKMVPINGYIWNIKIDVDNISNVKVNMLNNYGFQNNSIDIYVDGPAKGTISWNYFEPSENLLNGIAKHLDGVDTVLTCPFRIDCSISLKNNSYLEQYQNNFASYMSYDDFFDALRDTIIGNVDLNAIPIEYKAKIFINPVFYKESSFNITGLDTSNSILINNIPKELFVIRISDIYVEDINEHYSI